LLVCLLTALLTVTLASTTVLTYAAEDVAPPNWCCAFVVKATASFAWLRTGPSSAAPPRLTLFPGAVVTADPSRPQAALVWDGVQWWGKVRVAIFSFVVDGWVEVSSLTPAPLRASRIGPAATWQTGTMLRVRAAVPFVWLRSFPFSYAAAVHTVGPNTVLRVLGNPAPDMRQWWWPVQDMRSGVWGWVEQGSLEPDTGGVPTPVAATPTLVVATPAPDAFTESQLRAAYQPFENGEMLWLSNDGTIYVLLKNGQARLYSQATYGPLAENPITDPAPAGRAKPVSGFGRVWGHFAEVRTALGWALGTEQGYTATLRLPIGNSTYFLVTLPGDRIIRIRTLAGGMAWEAVR
jgi:hypothetical protein